MTTAIKDYMADSYEVKVVKAMTQNQIMKKCKIAKEKGEAILPGGDRIWYDNATKEYSLHAAWKLQTICVTYKPEYIAQICAD